MAGENEKGGIRPESTQTRRQRTWLVERHPRIRGSVPGEPDRRDPEGTPVRTGTRAEAIQKERQEKKGAALCNGKVKDPYALDGFAYQFGDAERGRPCRRTGLQDGAQ